MTLKTDRVRQAAWCRKLGPVLASRGIVILLIVVGGSLAFGAQEGRTMTDEELTLAVETDLTNDSRVPENFIDVNTREGIVTLSGKVPHLLAKERASSIAQLIKGVQSVVNLIDVNPARPVSDERIEQNVVNALLEDPAIDGPTLDVEVTNGMVTLTGDVNSWAEKDLAGEAAKQVRGVIDLENAIEVQYVESRPDKDIQEDIARRLRMDAWLDDRLLDVEVEKGKVRLSGIVSSLDERNRAVRKAWVVGVQSVDGAGITIKGTIREQLHRNPEYALISDVDIKHAIIEAFRDDPRLMASAVDVRVKAGKVTLTGTVDHLKAKQAAEQDALHTVGVWGVSNLLKIRPEEAVPDEEIAEGIRDALDRSVYLQRYGLSAHVYDGEAYLAGTVDRFFEKDEATEVASRVKGVTEVVNRIQVRAAWEPKADWMIVEDIKEELWLSPYVDSGDVQVSVKHGVATLTGQVDSWHEHRVAAENAYEGGAKRVRNQLEVELPVDE